MDEGGFDRDAFVTVHLARTGKFVRDEERARIGTAFVRDPDRDVVGMVLQREFDQLCDPRRTVGIDRRLGPGRPAEDEQVAEVGIVVAVVVRNEDRAQRRRRDVRVE